LIGGSARNIEIGNVTTGSQNIKIGNASGDSEITIGDTIDGPNTNKSKLTLGGAYASTESDSFVQIDTKALKVAGDFQLGTRRGLSDLVKLESTAGTVEFFSGNSATSTIKFGENSSEITIAGQGGTTTVRNNLLVDGYLRGNSDITLCGGYASYSFKALRAQAGTIIEPHSSGILSANTFNKNVDIIDVLRSTASTGEFNQIDTAGSGEWGGNASHVGQVNFQATPAGQSVATFPDLTGTDKYYLPIKKTPYAADGSQYYTENDILLIDTEEGYGLRASLDMGVSSNILATSTDVGLASSSSNHTGAGTGSDGGFNNNGLDYLWFSRQVDNVGNDGRYVILPKIDASAAGNSGIPLERVEIESFVGNNNNGGEYPDVIGTAPRDQTSESLWLQYSTDADPTLSSATWTSVGEIIPIQGTEANIPNGTSTYGIDVPTAAQVSSVAFRLYQPTNTGVDNYGITKVNYKALVGGAPEFVRVTRLPQINTTPYYVEVQRQPFGTFSSINFKHPDTTAIYKCIVQFDATWLTQDVDGAVANFNDTDDIYLAQFGGNLDVDDYVILSRRDLSDPADNIFDDGEILKLKSTLSQVAKKFSVKNGCNTANETTVFEVDSVTGNVTINGDQTYTGALTINGTCATPFTNSTTNKKLTITNGSGVKTFEVDTCTGDTQIGNKHGVHFAVAESFGTSPAAYTTSDVVHVYKHDPQSTNPNFGSVPFTTIATAVVPATSNIQIQSNYDSFTIGDLVAIYDSSQIEIIQITANPFLTGTSQFLPTASNANYPNGGRGVEGTTAISAAVGLNVVKLNKLGTTTLLEDLPGTRALRALSFKARTPNTSDTRLELGLLDADLIQPKLDYIQFIRIGSEFFLTDSVDGSLDAFYAIKMPKSIRYPNAVATPLVNLFNGGKTVINDDVTINSGVFRMYGSDSKTLVLSIANDDGHAGDGSIEDPITNTNGMTLKGAANFFGDLRIFYENCQSTGVCNNVESIKMTSREGSLFIGDQYYQAGKVTAVESSSDKIFQIDNLGSAGVGGTAGAKDFTIYQNNAIDSFGIEKYWTANGGRRHTYVAFDASTGIGQQETNPLQSNNNYLINASSGSNMVLYLPDNPQTGDMIRITELSGNLTYNTSLIIRAKKINNVATAIQGDNSGSKLEAGNGQFRTVAWDSGEMVVQTRNCAFGLVFVGVYDIEGSTSQQTIPASLRGWWLMEL